MSLVRQLVRLLVRLPSSLFFSLTLGEVVERVDSFTVTVINGREGVGEGGGGRLYTPMTDERR